jgi:DNA (cytosine-5)-methyltransferase 1
MEVVGALRPRWVVFENVANLLHSNAGRDLQTVVTAFAERGYLGSARVLDSAYFGVPPKRRRLFVVAGLGRRPPRRFLAHAGPMESLPCAGGSRWWGKPADAWAGYTLTAPDKHRGQSSRINLGNELLVAEEDGWGAMAERGREVELHGFPCGLDAPDTEEAYAAGNAVVPQIAQWLAELLNEDET